jgi:hypothetical protein
MDHASNPGDQAAAKDRRRETRHKVYGTAILNLVNLGIRMPGRVQDLSLGGCCIRTDERFILGIYRRIEVEFRIEGLPFRLAGVTQSIHDAHHVGIRFLNVSDRKREQLLQLIEEMEEFLKAPQAAKKPVDEDSLHGEAKPPAESSRD